MESVLKDALLDHYKADIDYEPVFQLVIRSFPNVTGFYHICRSMGSLKRGLKCFGK